MKRSRYKKGLLNRTPEKIKQREYNELYNKTVRQIRETNKRLKKLKRFNYNDKYSSKRLTNRLSSYKLKSLVNNKIKIPKKTSTLTSIRSLNNATRMFLNSLTSTIKGIKEMEEAQKKGIQDMFEDNEIEVTNEDVEDYYSLFEDDDFNFFADKIGSSTLMIIINYIQDTNNSLDFFISQLENYIEISHDDDLKDRAERLYYRYVA